MEAGYLDKFVLCIIIIAVLIERFSLIIKFDKINYMCRANIKSADIDEIFTIESSVTNNGAMFIPSLEITEDLPHNIKLQGQNLHVLNNNSTTQLTTAFYIGRYEKVTMKIQASINKRGFYNLGDCKIMRSDFLGFYKPNTEIQSKNSIIIYPRKIENDSLNIALSNFYGDFITSRMLIRDPVMVKGYHDYTGFEPFKDISWNQTAKRNNLIVKEYDFTQEQKVNVVLDVTYKDDFGDTLKNLETCFSLSRAICEYLENKNITYRFTTNAQTYVNEKNIISIDSYGNNNIVNILELLGSSTYRQACTLKEYFEYLESLYRKNNLCNNSIIYISTKYDGETKNYFEILKKQNRITIYPFYAVDYCEEDIKNAS